MTSSTNKRPRIVVVGSIVFDCVAMADRLPRKGETVLGRKFGMFSGGKGANQAVQIARLGAEVFMVGRVGKDFLAEYLLKNLNASGVDTRYVKQDASVATGACCIHVDAAGDNTIIIVPEANMACSPEDVDAAREVIASADVVVCQFEVAMPAVIHTLDLAARLGVRTVLNPAPAAPIPDGLGSKVTVLTPNETEAEAISGVALPSCEFAGNNGNGWEIEASTRLLSMGPQAVVITLGQRGACLTTPSGQQNIPAYRVSPVDVTAAGDAFNGALAVAMAEGKDMEQAVRFANAAGGLAATRAGSQPSLATRGELEDFLRTAVVAS
jgi:ribokinase